tara:strand:+ start:1347 stop:2372 length:1026 start_codon:yes stop_codon:yes gene_type:complete
MKKNFASYKKKIDNFFLKVSRLSKKNPLITVLLMHEYFRNIYPADLIIKKRYNKDPIKNFDITISKLEIILETFLGINTYKNLNTKLARVNTQKLFGDLWESRYEDFSLDQKNFLKRLLKKMNFNIRNFKDKKVLDMGCGSGRFTIAFARLGPKKVYGVDLGDQGLKVGRKLCKKFKLKNATFKKSSVLSLPFRNSYFDFVFCKGVLHHTGKLKKSLNEFVRLIKKNGHGFLYLYGSGGIFWYSRKKMRKVMKNIPYKFTMNVLKLYGMPAVRTVFVDSWYVPIEEHVTKNSLENFFKRKKLKFKKYDKALPIELESMKKNKNFRVLYGDGEHRYLVKKTI